MTARCYDAALRIAQSPRDGWAEQIKALPEACPHTDCTPAIGCRERIRDYLRVQFQAARLRERK